MQHIHIHVNDKVHIPSFPTSGEPVQSVSVDVEIPEGDFELTVCYSVQQQMSEDGHTMYLEENDCVELYGVSHEEHYKYFDCYLLTADAYTVTRVLFRVADGEWLDVNDVAGCSFSRSETVENVYSISIRPDYLNVTGDVTLRVSGEQHSRYDIVWENATAEYLDMEKSVLPVESIDGETVIAELWVNDAFYLENATASVPGLGLETVSRAYVRFVMPASDVVVTLDIREKIPVTYTGGDHVSEAKFYDADDIFYGVETSVGIPGESVYLFATAEEGFKPMQAVIDTGERFDFEYYAPGMYRSRILIPEDAEKLSASIETAPAYIVTAEGGDIVFDEGYVYAAAETVSMSIHVPEGQRIADVDVSDAQGNDIPVTLDLPYASFQMPASDVMVRVAYEDIDAGQEVSVIAFFDADAYNVNSSTNYDWDFAEGFTTTKGSTFYLTVYNWDGENFYVGVQIGTAVTVYPAELDEMMGEYSFGKALVADGDVTIKVGASASEVAF